MTYAIICAAGSGLRFGGEIPKQFIETGGEPILLKTVKVFEKTDAVKAIIVVCPESYIDKTAEILSQCSKTCITAGGADRNLSVMNGIAFIEKRFGLDEDTIVVTHDAVRPFVTERMINESIEEAKKYGASAAAIPAVDTVIETENGKITNVPDRSRMYMVQTPQTFYAKKLREIYNSLTEDEKKALTDCTRIYVSKGETVKIISGDVKNIKITYRTDIE